MGALGTWLVRARFWGLLLPLLSMLEKCEAPDFDGGTTQSLRVR